MKRRTNALEERIRVMSNSGELFFWEKYPDMLIKLLNKKKTLIYPRVRTKKIGRQNLWLVSFEYPKEEIGEIIDSVRQGNRRLLEKTYSTHIVEYEDTNHFGHFTVRRYSGEIVYFPKFRDWAFFVKQTFISWYTEVANFDDTGDIGEGVHESGWSKHQKVVGPLKVSDSCLEIIAKAYNYQGDIKKVLKMTPKQLVGGL